ncbi:MAG: periplasmic heavy metal sensor [Paracoccaceae bacterium]
MENETLPPKKSGSRWLRLLLVASLALNLLIVGMIAGAIFRGGPPDHIRRASAPPLYDLGYGPYARALSKDDRQQITSAMGELGPDLRANRADFRAHLVLMLEALRQSPYKPETVSEILSQQQSRLQERQDIGKTLFLSQIAEMTDDERAKYADRLERSLRRAPKSN